MSLLTSNQISYRALPCAYLSNILSTNASSTKNMQTKHVQGCIPIHTCLSTCGFSWCHYEAFTEKTLWKNQTPPNQTSVQMKNNEAEETLIEMWNKKVMESAEFW